MSNVQSYVPQKADKGVYGEGEQNVIFQVAYPANGKRKVQIVSYVPSAVGDFLGEVDSLIKQRQRSKLIRRAVAGAVKEVCDATVPQFDLAVSALASTLNCGLSSAIIAATRWWIANRRTVDAKVD